MMLDLLTPLALRSDPVPNSWAARFVPFDRADPRAQEPLVDLADAGLAVRSWYAQTDGRNPPYNQPIAGASPIVAARSSVAKRLQWADSFLAPCGCRLLAVDAYRSIETQKGLWAFFEAEIAGRNPGLNQASLDDKIRTFVSDPRRFDRDDETSWPLHSTGGAVDVLLMDAAEGAILDHGAGFDEAQERSYTDHYERLFLKGEIGEDDHRLVNRRLLVNAMLKAGFTNYAYEFWHFDYGTQLYVLTLQAAGRSDAPTSAWYGTTILPESFL